MKFEDNFIRENLMGPNAVKLLEELIPLSGIAPSPGMRMMDLGCGTGLTSMTLADKFDAQIFAVDLWIGATENYERFKAMGMDQRIIPIHADATALPFADEYFDAVVSVDSYLYFGGNEKFMDEKLAPLVKKGGIIALAVPGLKKDIHANIPAEMLLSWTPEDLETMHCGEWWRALLSRSKKIELLSVGELGRFDECWNDWLACDNPYAVSDRASMNAGAGKYMNIVYAICRRV